VVVNCEHGNLEKFTQCAVCKTIVFPKEKENYFDFFSIHMGFNLDLNLLETSFHKISRLIHPDKHFDSHPENIISVTNWFAEINKAYVTLKNPLDRARYILDLVQVENFCVVNLALVLRL
jgi:molecular chaperone HscB